MGFRCCLLLLSVLVARCCSCPWVTVPQQAGDGGGATNFWGVQCWIVGRMNWGAGRLRGGRSDGWGVCWGGGERWVAGVQVQSAGVKDAWYVLCRHRGYLRTKLRWLAGVRVAWFWDCPT
jgi:hypothetical protein